MTSTGLPRWDQVYAGFYEPHDSELFRSPRTNAPSLAAPRHPSAWTFLGDAWRVGGPMQGRVEALPWGTGSVSFGQDHG